MNTELIKATTPTDLAEQVKEALEQKSDLYGGLFVSHEGLLCQFMVSTPSWYEYALIVAGDLDEYKRQIDIAIDNGFDHFHHTVKWNNQWYLQWMCRHGAGKLVAHALKQAQPLQVVVDAQASLRLVPIGQGSYSVVVPHPVNFS